jgi:hypothetical protein
MSFVTSASVCEARKRSRRVGESLLREPAVLARFTMRPEGLRRGRKVWHAARVL